MIYRYSWLKIIILYTLSYPLQWRAKRAKYPPSSEVDYRGNMRSIYTDSYDYTSHTQYYTIG